MSEERFRGALLPPAPTVLIGDTTADVMKVGTDSDALSCTQAEGPKT